MRRRRGEIDKKDESRKKKEANHKLQEQKQNKEKYGKEDEDTK